MARYLGASAEQIVFPLPDLSKETVSVQEKLQKNELQGEYIVVVPGARWKTKEWPAEHYASLIKMIIAIGQHSVKTVMKIQIHVFILIFVIKPVKEFEKDFNQTIGGLADALRVCWVGRMLHVGKGQKNILDLIHGFLLIGITMTAFAGKENVTQVFPGQVGSGEV